MQNSGVCWLQEVLIRAGAVMGKLWELGYGLGEVMWWVRQEDRARSVLTDIPRGTAGDVQEVY